MTSSECMTCSVQCDVTAQSDGRVLSWFQCWQAVSGFLSALCELQAKL